ncbi:hypothetical protein F157LOC_01674 [Pectobacterium brasiliense]|uniref:hypothetical protein n=1 Tax=Pectobacterium TaxID=122277 RepID=UPI000CDE1ACF|nr:MULTISPECIES: hypothetical protein [Pectobacterium]AYH05121.1 hypothetical protein C5E25_07010 [Pectobacterium parmentieri]AYH13942.1 hypothetical protein C5E23_06985 [Pectobacterium parmentieri]AYH22645.1 hypothetical protein C5E21_06990 [Pectobacterium parmentieri]MBN3179498.1 hypothetical protein [Pectobacterium parmentieri]POW23973.1 hypothetical protein PB20LOC_04211 [Pectobacterium parmentieri]
MFQFKELIKTGMESASEVERNRKSINDVFLALNQELHEETQGLIKVRRFTNKPNALFDMAKAYNMVSQGLDPTISIEKSTDVGTLNIALSDDIHAPVARWEQHPNGYPFTIEFLGERTDCWDQDSLVRMLGKIVSSGQFWLKVKELEFQKAKKVKLSQVDKPSQDTKN